MPRRDSFIDGERLLKAHTPRRVEPLYESLATTLATLPPLRYIKLFSGQAECIEPAVERRKEKSCRRRRR
jgi:hypothetical protein